MGVLGGKDQSCFFVVEMITHLHIDPGLEGCNKHVTNLYMGNGVVTQVKPVDMCSWEKLCFFDDLKLELRRHSLDIHGHLLRPWYLDPKNIPKTFQEVWVLDV